MGQKTHPLGFRLGITKEHESKWYTNFKNYKNIIHNDYKLRSYIYELLENINISNILINRNSYIKGIEVIIKTSTPDVLFGNDGTPYKKLVKDITKFLGYDKKKSENDNISVLISKVDKRSDAGCLADFVVEQLEERVAFRKVIKSILDRTTSSNIRGIKVQISGRLNGAEIARTEWIRQGRVPLQTLRANINYATREAHTIYGVLGIKIWVFHGEYFNPLKS